MDPQKSASKRHLDRFSRFAGLEVVTSRHTEIHRVKWRHSIYGHDTIVILWVKPGITCGVIGWRFTMLYTHTHTYIHTYIHTYTRLTALCPWHQLGCIHVCTSLQADNHASTSPLSFFTGRMPFLPPNQQRQSTEGKDLPCYLNKI